MPSELPVSVSAAKLFLRVDHDVEDVLIESLIAGATAEAEDYLGRALVSRDVTLTLPAFPGLTVPIELAPLPVSAVTEIAYVDPDGDPHVVDPANYSLHADEWSASIRPRTLWPATEQRPDAVTVDFVAGYGAAEDVPPKVAVAIQFLVSHWYHHREGQPPPDTFHKLLDLHGRLIPAG